MDRFNDIKERVLADKRVAQRLTTSFPAFITTRQGQEAAAVVTNVSSSGLQLTGDFQFVRICMPNIHRTDRPLPVSIDVYFEVPSKNQLMTAVVVQCGMVYLQRDKNHQFIAGCEFKQFKHNSNQHLEQFIKQHSQPI